MYYLLFALGLFIGFTVFLHAGCQVFMTLFISIPTTLKHKHSGSKISKKIYALFLYVIFIWTLISIGVIALFLFVLPAPMYNGLMLGLIIGLILAFANSGDSYDNMSDFYTAYSKYIDIDSENIIYQGKTRYCKYCGGEINSDKICSNCGHKYFKIRLSKKKTKYIVILIISALIIYAFVYLLATLMNYRTALIDQNTKVAKQDKIIDELNEQISSYDNALSSSLKYEKLYNSKNLDYIKLSNKYNSEKRNLDWYNENVALVTIGGNKYHRIDCYHLNNKSFYIYYVEDAEAKGYGPCLDCEYN